MNQSNKHSRIGVVDVGSNSVRLVVFDGMSRSPAYFFNEKVLCGLGAGLAETGMLNPKGKERAFAALHRFTMLVREMGVAVLTGVATAAVREATDGPEFVAQVAKETGLELHVASGVEEAQLASKGVLLGWPDASGLVCDIGGASMELAQIRDGAIGACATSPLGPLKLRDFKGDLDVHIDEKLTDLLGAVGDKTERLYLVGGSWRALSRLDMARQSYPFKVLHEYKMQPQQLLETAEWVQSQTPEELGGQVDSSQERLSLVPDAARVMTALITKLQPETIVVSSYGLREGMFYEQMPVETRKLDPLIEACRNMEETMARFPGFGQQLYDWLMPLYQNEDVSEKRLIQAACLLHDTSWRSHPDYRAEMCFESVTRANLGGIDHLGRLFLGVAILNRYKNSGYASLEVPIMELLPKERINTAVVLGKAMRLGAMLSGAQAGLLKQSEISIVGDNLLLQLTGQAVELNGEVVEKRLISLARRLGLEPELQFT